MKLDWICHHIGREGWRPLVVGLRCAFAALGAVQVSLYLGLRYPIYALVAAIMVTEYQGEETRKQSSTRFLGNSIGITCGAALSSCVGSHFWAIGLATFFMVLFCYYFGLAVAAKYSAFVAALTVLDHSATPWLYGRDRITETLIGIIFAVLMSFLIPTPESKEKPSAKTKQKIPE